MFMTYDEVISGIENKTLQGSFIAIFFRSKDNFFGFYTIDSPDQDDDDFENIIISYEGGYLFSSIGEEDFYSLDDVPEEAKFFLYKDRKEYVDISGFNSEYALFKLFPALQDPETIFTLSSEKKFIESIKVKALFGF